MWLMKVYKRFSEWIFKNVDKILEGSNEKYK